MRAILGDALLHAMPRHARIFEIAAARIQKNALASPVTLKAFMENDAGQIVIRKAGICGAHRGYSPATISAQAVRAHHRVGASEGEGRQGQPSGNLRGQGQVFVISEK